MFFTKYTRGRPRAPAWVPAMPLYVCEFRYKDDVKAFKKIKSWSSCVPEEMRKHEYEFEPYPDDRVDTLHKIKSPFVRGVAGPGRLDVAGAAGAGGAGGAAASPTYHFSQDGKPATAQEVQDEGHARDLVVGGGGDSMQVDPSSSSNALAVDAALASFGAPPPPPLMAAGGPSASDLSTSAALAALSSSLDALPGTTSGTASTPTVELQSAPAAAPTPAELAAANEAFAPLPPSIGASSLSFSLSLSQGAETDVDPPFLARSVQVPLRHVRRRPLVRRPGRRPAVLERRARRRRDALARVPVLARDAKARGRGRARGRRRAGGLSGSRARGGEGREGCKDGSSCTVRVRESY